MMSNNNPVSPEDILPDGMDSTFVNGTLVRKGSMAAFLANADILENPEASEKQKQEAIEKMKILAIALNAIGLHKHVVFKNPIIEQILINASKYGQ